MLRSHLEILELVNMPCAVKMPLNLTEGVAPIYGYIGIIGNIGHIGSIAGMARLSAFQEGQKLYIRVFLYTLYALNRGYPMTGRF